MLRSVAGLVVAVLALTACPGEVKVVELVDGREPPVVVGGVDDLGAPGMQLQDVGKDLGDGRWSIEVPAEAASMLVVALGDGPEDTVRLLDLVLPDDTSLGDTVAFPENGGEFSLLLPRHADDPFPAGTWTIHLEAEHMVTDVRLVFEVGGVDHPQEIDLVAWVVTDHPDVANDRRQDLAAGWREVGDAAFSPHDLAVGSIRFLDAPDAVRRAFSELELPTTGDDLEQRRLCAALDAAGADRRLTSADARALHVAIVDEIVDREDPDGETEGNAAGIPGAAGLAGTSTSCVVVTAGGTRSLFEMPEVLWHEAGHLLGLPHTTESTGDAFDFFIDTDECDVDEFDEDDDEYLDAEECPDGENLMFHDGSGWEISEEQAWLLRRHPLFVPSSQG